MSDYQRDNNKNNNELSNYQKSFATSMLLLLLCLVSSCMCLGTLSLHTVVVNSKLDVRIKGHCLNGSIIKQKILIRWYFTMKRNLLNSCNLVSNSKKVRFYMFGVVRIY